MSGTNLTPLITLRTPPPTVMNSYTHSGFLFSCLISYILLLCCVNQVRLRNPGMVSAQTSVYRHPTQSAIHPSAPPAASPAPVSNNPVIPPAQPPSAPTREPLYPLRSSTLVILAPVAASYSNVL